MRTSTGVVVDVLRSWWRPLAVAGLSVLAVPACAPPAAPVALQGTAMGTTYSVTVATRPPGIDQWALQAVIDGVIAEAESVLSTWNPGSAISRFNAERRTDWIAVPEELVAVVAEAQQVSRETGGAFDVTVAPLVRLWGFDERRGATAWPADEAIHAAQASTGFQRLELRARPPALRKADAALELDVAGIAPGYAVDRIAAGFDALGAGDYLIELGGEIRARGRRAPDRPWRVAVERPVPGERQPYTIVELDGAAVSTSGDYRDYREIGGRRVSHTIDPRSGRPVDHDLASVTVIDGTAARADALATALMVLGPDAGFEFARENGIAALFLVRRAGASGFDERVTPAFAQRRK